MKKCPYCGEMIQDSAIKCRYCGEWLKKPDNLAIVTKNDNNKTIPKETTSQNVITNPIVVASIKDEEEKTYKLSEDEMKVSKLSKLSNSSLDLATWTSSLSLLILLLLTPITVILYFIIVSGNIEGAPMQTLLIINEIAVIIWGISSYSLTSNLASCVNKINISVAKWLGVCNSFFIVTIVFEIIASLINIQNDLIILWSICSIITSFIIVNKYKYDTDRLLNSIALNIYLVVPLIFMCTLILGHLIEDSASSQNSVIDPSQYTNSGVKLMIILAVAWICFLLWWFMKNKFGYEYLNQLFKGKSDLKD